MLMLSLALGLVALDHTRLAVVGWIAGIAAFAVVVSFDFEPFLRVELALVAAVLAGYAGGRQPAAAPVRGPRPRGLSESDPPGPRTSTSVEAGVGEVETVAHLAGSA